MKKIINSSCLVFLLFFGSSSLAGEWAKNIIESTLYTAVSEQGFADIEIDYSHDGTGEVGNEAYAFAKLVKVTQGNMTKLERKISFHKCFENAYIRNSTDIEFLRITALHELAHHMVWRDALERGELRLSGDHGRDFRLALQKLGVSSNDDRIGVQRHYRGCPRSW